MKCAIQLAFDDVGQNQINEIRKQLAFAGVRDVAVRINHISLADIEVDDEKLEIVKALVSNFAKERKALKLVIASAGSFMSKENVLFLAPIITEELINYNEDLVNMLVNNGVQCGKYYTKNNWQPHCTIAIKISDNELVKGFEVLKQVDALPLVVNVDKIDILRYAPQPYEELVSYDLNECL